MKAIILTRPGGTEQLTPVTLQTPEPKSGEVLVEVKAISINPVDIKTRKGLALYNSLKDEDPVILGWDISGTIVQVGEGVAGFKEGDPVFGMVNFPGHGKAYAEFVAAPADHLAHKPGSLTHEEAAASTLALLTAWQVLVQEAKLQAGERLLMQAAAGGVGHFGVQVGHYLGARVAGTASGSNETFCRELGVEEFADYTGKPLEEQLAGVDVVFDAVGGDSPLRALPVLKRGGRMVCIAGGITDEVKERAAGKDIRVWPYLVKSSGSDLQQLTRLLQEGIIRPHILRTYPFDDMADAHRQIESGHTRGKIVLTI